MNTELQRRILAVVDLNDADALRLATGSLPDQTIADVANDLADRIEHERDTAKREHFVQQLLRVLDLLTERVHALPRKGTSHG